MTLDDLKSQLTQAEVAEDIGNYDEAERLSQQILVELSSGGYADLTDSERSALGAGATCMLGVVSWRRGAYTPALEQLYAALHISQQVRDNAGAAKVLGCIGTVYWSLNDYSKALEFYSDSLSIELELGNQSGIAKQLGSIGLVHWNLCDYSKAMEYYVEALRIDEELGNKRGVARHLGNIGNVHWSFSDYPKALEFYSRALSIDEDLCNVSGVAIWLGNIGNVYMKLCNYSKALEYCGKALDIEQQLGNNAGVATWLSNIGNVHMDLSDYSKALTYYTMALRMEQEIGNKAREAMWLGNIGNVHLSLSDYSKALEYYLKVLSVDEALGNKLGMATWLGNIGLVYWYLSDYPKALEQYIRALNLCEEIGNVSGVATYLGNVGGVLMGLGDYEMAEDYLSRSLYVREQLGVKSELGELKAILGELYAIDANPNRDFAKAETFLLQSIAVAEELGTKKFDAHKTLAELYEKQERWEEAFYQQGKYFTLKEEVQSEEAKNAAQLMEQQKQIAEREKEIAIAKATAAAQMSATTTLLHKVLPESVATRMISGEVEIADYFTNVSILFADIAGFTPISADMPAIIVVRFLNYVFGEFDRIIKKHGCEKIKTIGDGYMAIAGAPLECADHAERLAAAALEMQETITLPESIREYMPSGVKLGVRIGLHTGSVVAGVIGEERFVYDIYSDAVNTAARMESHGEENKIHVSNDFFRHLQNRFAMTKNTTHGFVFEKRGEMEIKGKGMMRTYFLEKA